MHGTLNVELHRNVVRHLFIFAPYPFIKNNSYRMGLNKIVSDHFTAQTVSFQTVAKEFPVRSKAFGVGFVVNISGIKVRVIAVIHNDFCML